MKKSSPSPEETADQVARTFFGVGDDKASRQRAIRGLLLAAVESVVLVPLLFYLRFGAVTGLGWGLTIFFAAYCLLATIGLYFRPKSEFHTPVKLRGDWLDHLGAFWLVSCAFGPFFGWIATSAFPITAATWRWLYALRVFLAIVLPLATALPLTRYLRGKATLIALPILVVITLLPIWSAVNIGRDLWNGPVVQQVQPNSQPQYYLPYTGRSFDITH